MSEALFFSTSNDHVVWLLRLPLVPLSPWETGPLVLREKRSTTFPGHRGAVFRYHGSQRLTSKKERTALVDCSQEMSGWPVGSKLIKRHLYLGPTLQF